MNSDASIKTLVPTQDAGFLYAAFISYRHVARDRAAAEWLLKALETYRVPSGLRHSRGLPARLARVFRDEDELPSSADLNESITRALEQSRVLIAICSPDLKKSRWCRTEIRQFREWDRPVLALIVAGEPSSGEPGLDPFTEELRTRLRREQDPDGAVRFIAVEAEPIAADLRPRPGVPARHIRQVARVKIVAALLGVTFDELWQRDRRRQRQRRALSGTIAVLALMTAVLGLRIVAKSREEAKSQSNSRVAADLSSAALSGRDLDAETRALLALHAWRLHEANRSGDMSSIDSALRASLAEIGSLCDKVEWSTSVPVESVLSMSSSDSDPESIAAAALGAGMLRGAGSAGGVMSVGFLPNDTAVVFGLCTTPTNQLPRSFGLWAFPRCDEPALFGFAPGPPQMMSPASVAGTRGLAPTIIAESPTGRIAALVASQVVIRLRENDGLDGSNWFHPSQLPGRTTSIAFDPTSDSSAFRLAYAGDSQAVRICSVVVGGATSFVELPAGAAIGAIGYRSDGGGLAAGCSDGSVRIWTAIEHGHAPDLILRAHRAAVNCVAFSPDGAMLASAGEDGVAAVWDLRHPDAPMFQIRARVAPDERVAQAVAFSSRGDLAIGWREKAGSGSVAPETFSRKRADGSVYLYRRASISDPSGPHDPVVLLPSKSGGIRSLAFNRSGSLLAAGCEDLSIHVWVAMPDDLVAFARRFVKRELTADEWTRFTQNRAPFEPALP